jgi:UDP-3-O-[3-hydroxymyristoyl] glucosamine N-acyltransferase
MCRIPPREAAEVARHTLEAVAAAVKGELIGDQGLLLDGVRAPESAGPSDLAVLTDPGRTAVLDAVRAGALILPPGVDAPGRNVVYVSHPKLALIDVLELFHPRRVREGIQPGAHVSSAAHVAPGVFVAAGATVEAGARIAERCEVHAGVFVGERVIVGEDCVLFPGVTLYPGTRLGRRVRVHAGSVIGADGFGYEKGAASLRKVPQVGGVEIGDDVEIGANCTIDRATLETTLIGARTKIDNLVQIAHNCVIGEDCIIVSQVGISGSVTLGAGCILSGQSGVADHATLAAGTVIGAQAGVPSSRDGGIWLGTPALPIAQARRVFAALAKLPETRKELLETKERCARLEERLAELLGNRGPERP